MLARINMSWSCEDEICDVQVMTSNLTYTHTALVRTNCKFTSSVLLS